MCQDISVLTVIDLSTLACDIGGHFYHVELTEYMMQMKVENEAAAAYLQKINWDGVAEGGLSLARNEIYAERFGSVVVEWGGLLVWMILNLIVAELGHGWLQI